MNFCSECGAKLTGGAPKFCGECGHQLAQAGSPVDSRPNSELSDEELLAKANAGDAEAIKDVGIRHQKAGDNEAARQWFERAAEMGHAGAMRNLGVLRTEVDDHEGALAWFIQSAESGSNLTMGKNSITDRRPVTVAARAASQAARELFKMGRFDEAEQWIQRSKDMDDDQAVVLIAGDLFKAKDPRALEWCTRASDEGDVRGTTLVISLLIQQKRYIEVAPYLERYIEMDPDFTVIEQENVALFSRFVGLSFGVEKDLTSSRSWLERSEQLGDPEAAGYLSMVVKEINALDARSALDEASDPSTDAARLAELADDPVQFILRSKVAGNPSTPAEVLTRLADDPESDVRDEVAKNPSTPVEILAGLSGTEVMKNPTVKALEEEAKESTDEARLSELASSPLWLVRRDVAGNP